MLSRRNFIKFSGAAAGTAALTLDGTTSARASSLELDPARFGVLVDYTLCISCRCCEWACAREHDLPFGSLEACDDTTVFEETRRPDATRFTVVNQYEARTELDRPLGVKVQCLHCEHPACVSACIVGALEKSPKGPVTYDADKCIGCRYCMIACPFQIPAYEYQKALTPKVMKCDMCASRTLEKNQVPACVEICPQEALVFGRRDELLKLARERLRWNPDRYHPEIFGENSVGGTSWLMLADRNFQDVDLPAVADESPAVVTEAIQHGIFKGFSGPLMLFGLLSVLMRSSGDKQKEKEDDNV